MKSTNRPDSFDENLSVLQETHNIIKGIENKYQNYFEMRKNRDSPLISVHNDENLEVFQKE